MELDDIARTVGSTPNMTLDQARRLEKLVEEYELRSFLELGFAHGVGTSYLAALACRRNGSVVAIDRAEARSRRPSAEETLAATGMAGWVDMCLEATTYNWRLMRMLEDGRGPRFDLCYLDGAHNWTVDGLAFSLVDQLLYPGGWIVFDDLNWSYATSSISAEPWVLELADDERTEAHVRKVWDLLVLPNPRYGSFREEGNWGFAQKLADGDTRAVEHVIVRQSLPDAARAALSVTSRRVASLRRKPGRSPGGRGS
jgi:predicted O-methyltransferase YrrM